MKKLYLVLFVFICCKTNAQWKYANYPEGGGFWQIAATEQAVYTNLGDIFVSTDSGKHWNITELGLPPYYKDKLAASKNKIFTVAGDGLYSSADNGKSWSFSGDGISDTVFITGLEAQDSVVLAGTNNKCLYRSTDNGVSWKLTNVQPESDNFIFDIQLKGNYALACASSGLLISTDGGLTWTDSIAGLPDKTPYAISISKTMMFVDYGNEQYASTDNGANWKRITTNLPPDATVIDIASEDSLIYHGSTAGLYISKDGENFQHITSGLPDQYSVICLAVTNHGIYLGTTRNLYYSADHGKNWELRNTDIRKVRVPSAITDRGRIVTASSSGIIVSDDNGKTWKEKNYGLAQDSRGMSLSLLDSTLFMGTDLALFSSKNRGDVWEEKAMPPFFQTMELRTHEGVVYAAGMNSGIFASYDKGVTWKDISSDLPSLRLYAMGFHKTTLFAGIFFDGSYRSTDGGNSWTPMKGLPAALITKFETIGDVILAATNIGLYKSEDDGVSWTKLPEAPSNFITSIFYLKGFLWISYDKDLLISADMGSTWKSVRDGLPDVSVLSLMIKDNAIYAGTDNGLWVRNLNEILTEIPENKEAISLEIYPNPGNGLFYLSSVYKLLHIELFNMLGEKVYTADLKAGESQLDLSQFAKGMYMLQATSDQKLSISKKIIIQ